MAYELLSIQQFAEKIHKILQTDRDALTACSGQTGEGKSTFLGQLQQEYAKRSKTEWSFDRLTWSRKELMKWIDGEGENKKGRLPEYSAILADELFRMFYRRNWFEGGQIDAIGTFNMCRDRHLFLGGNVPNFWELDTGFTNRVKFFIYIPRRGVAWVFQQEDNPFSDDPWNRNENKRIMRKHKTPYKCANFLCEIHFNDWDEETKKQYLAIRNSKRLLLKNTEKTKDTPRKLRRQRDSAVYLAREYGVPLKELAEELKLTAQAISEIHSKIQEIKDTDK